MVPVGSALKRAVDYVLCALCYVQPAYFTQLLTWSGVRCEALTDDNKEALQGPSAPDLLLAIDDLNPVYLLWWWLVSLQSV